MKTVKIISIQKTTHDVVHIKTEKPTEIDYLPGQAVDVALNTPQMKDELRAFTFTSLPNDAFLEFYIKIYPEHDGVTKQIATLKKNDTLLIGDTFGDIMYKGEGLFLAGGAGITPFLAILKNLEAQNKIGNNKLIFANKTSKDIIENNYFERLLKTNFTNVLSEEQNAKMQYGYITKELIKSNINNKQQFYYLCGPPPMMDAVLKHLEILGIDKSKIVKEQF
ncbi:MAG: flavodoxin reductase [Gelidibacter sp.]|nr:flavodoxin reductase [Gelidibacter sp.]